MNINFEYEIVTSIDDIGKDDHVIAIVDEVPTIDTDPKGVEKMAGRAQMGGGVAVIESGSLDGTAAAHEIGHNLGLPHPSNPLSSNSLMGYAGGTTVGAPSLMEIGANLLLVPGGNRRSESTFTLQTANGNVPNYDVKKALSDFIDRFDIKTSR